MTDYGDLVFGPESESYDYHMFAVAPSPFPKAMFPQAMHDATAALIRQLDERTELIAAHMWANTRPDQRWRLHTLPQACPDVAYDFERQLLTATMEPPVFACYFVPPGPEDEMRATAARLLAEYEAEHGVITDDEVAALDRQYQHL